MKKKNEPAASPLFRAIEANDLDALRGLVKTSAEANAVRDRDGLRALAWAGAFGDRTAIVAELLKRGADPNAPAAAKGPPVLSYFVAHGWRGHDLAAIESLLDAGAVLDAVDRDGQTALHAAARSGPIDPYAAEVTQVLLTRGARPNLQDHAGMSPLHFAAKTISHRTLKALLAAGASPTLRDEEGATALHHAIRVFGAMAEDDANDAEGVQRHHVSALLDHGADPNAETADGTTPLACAVAQRGYPLEVIARLLSAGADPAAPVVSLDGHPTCVDLATTVRPELAALLFRAKPALVQVAIRMGAMPLHVAALKGHTSLVATLLELGADPSVRIGKNRVTAADLAAKHGHTAIVAMLEGHRRR